MDNFKNKICPLTAQHAYCQNIKCMKLASCWTEEIEAMLRSNFQDVRGMAVDMEEELHSMLTARDSHD